MAGSSFSVLCIAVGGTGIAGSRPDRSSALECPAWARRSGDAGQFIGEGDASTRACSRCRLDQAGRGAPIFGSQRPTRLQQGCRPQTIAPDIAGWCGAGRYLRERARARRQNLALVNISPAPMAATIALEMIGPPARSSIVRNRHPGARWFRSVRQTRPAARPAPVAGQVFRSCAPCEATGHLVVGQDARHLGTQKPLSAAPQCRAEQEGANLIDVPVCWLTRRSVPGQCLQVS